MTVAAGDYVQLHDLSKAELNGRIGLVQNLNATSGRYNVMLRDGKVLGLKQENLEKAQVDFNNVNDLFLRLKGDFKEKGFKQFAQDEARGFIEALKELLPPGTEPSQIGMIFGAIFVGMFAAYGFLKATLVVYISFALFVVAYAPFKNAGGGVAGAKAAGKLLAENVQKVIKHYTGYDASEQHAYIALGVLAAFFIYAVFLSGGGKSTADSEVYKKFKAMESAEETSKEQLFQAYKIGFNDALAGKNFDESFAVYQESFIKEATPDVDVPVNVEDFEKPAFSLFSINRIIPLLFAGKMIYDLGGGSNWDYQLAWANFSNQPLWKRGLIIFAFVRMFM